jgi:hypothetical protein
MKFRDLKTDEQLLLLVGASLTILSLLALLFFIAVSAVSLVTWSVPHTWNLCFLLCAVSLGGWMLLYTGQVRIGGGVMVGIKNILLLYSLILAVVISAVVRFAGHQKYVAILALALALTTFYVAAPITNPITLLRLFRLWKNERIAGDGVNS